METVKLQAKKRIGDTKAKDLRKDGFVTAEYYGGGAENLSLMMDYQDFRRAYRDAGKSTVLELEIDGGEKTYALVHEVDYDPVTDKYIHIDFLHIDLNKEVSAKVPFDFVGESLAVKELQGTFMAALDGVEVKCLAKDLISSIEVDISGLEEFSDVIRVADLKVPETVTIITDLEEAVATVAPPKEEEEEPVVVEDEEGEEGEVAEGEEGAAPAEGEGGDKPAEGDDASKEEKKE